MSSSPAQSLTVWTRACFAASQAGLADCPCIATHVRHPCILAKAHTFLPLPRSRSGGAGRSFSTTGGLFAEEAIALLQRFYISGNPRGEGMMIARRSSHRQCLSCCSFPALTV